jgi:hypothetical protein
MLGGYVGVMPILQNDDGSYVALLDYHPVIRDCAMTSFKLA